MKTEMLMPQMGESIAEATILKWLKSPGDMVEKDETILEISTDKVDSEIPAPASGKLVEIVAEEGQTVDVKSVIAIIDSDSSAEVSETPNKGDSSETTQDAQKEDRAQEKKSEDSKTEQAPQQASGESKSKTSDRESQPASASSSVPSHSAGRFYSPLVRSMATKHGISEQELSQIKGSGANGRVTKEDFEFYLEHRSSKQTSSQTASTSTSASTKPAAPATPRPSYGEDGTSVEPMNSMRKLIAEHMVRSKATSPHVYSMAEVDVTAIGKWRKQQQSAFLAREGFKLSYTPFFLEATIQALMQFPRMNASVDGDNIILKRDVNLGCAVALGKGGLDGLIVPVIKNADQLNLTGIARGLNDIATRARSKKLKPDDVKGGTFTVTNPGIFGNIMGCPIINQPQLGILALGAIKKRPVVIDDAIAIRDIVVLTMSYDHRVIDGALSGQFLNFITKYLESWDMSRGI